ncbi:MAG: amidohydrolase [Chloroflexi bacterium]|jgi:L-fuconolactonase|nr:amidohydrolase [Chloroflexota bacterium]
MIIDSHCHSWAYWPYLPPVPDPETHGSVEQLINQMDTNGVERATIVCAQIFQNFDNNDYVAAAVKRYPHRLEQFADVDSMWSDTYHTPGAAKRLEQAAQRWPMKAFTHYVANEDDGSWFNSPDGIDFLSVAEQLGLIASISTAPHHQNELRKAIERHPNLNFLFHHMSGLRAHGEHSKANVDNVIETSKFPNAYLKLSGFHYLTNTPWNFPYKDALWVYEECYEAFGKNMVWGSDFPVVKKSMTHLQALEAFRTHCGFVSDADKFAILGGTLEHLLDNAREVTK